MSGATITNIVVDDAARVVLKQARAILAEAGPVDQEVAEVRRRIVDESMIDALVAGLRPGVVVTWWTAFETLNATGWDVDAACRILSIPGITREVVLLLRAPADPVRAFDDLGAAWDFAEFDSPVTVSYTDHEGVQVTFEARVRVYPDRPKKPP